MNYSVAFILQPTLQPSVLFPTKGLFSDTDGAPFSQSQRDEDDDRMSFISKKSVKTKGGNQMPKTDKRKLRHERWLESKLFSSV